ncbi:MAG: imidazole glycerol phosphate synthase subunit HisH [Elusimicrobia bacterium]|nr:imidazole glycerol phosphate synthase subunit HisH [Elusimicrobiota bacterium]
MKTVALVDYGIGNVDSVRRALQECGADVVLASTRADFERCSAIVLPGVGAFGDGMRHLRERGLVEILNEQVLDKKIPFLGVCLGMQMLAKTGFENESAAGLGWLDADCVRLAPTSDAERIPHIGWNEVVHDGKSPLFADLPAGKDFYFVHSYALQCRDSREVLSTTPYAGGFVSAAGRENIWGVQFHPEKSQKPGFQLLRNFLSR